MSRDRFLAAGVSLLEDTGEFPKLEWVQRSLVGWRDETNARREAKRLPQSLGAVEDGRVILKVRAIHRDDPGSNLLEAFRIGLRFAWTRYRAGKPPTDVLISASDLANDSNLSEDEARMAIQLLEVEGLARKATERVWAVAPTIRHYKSAHTVEAYLRRKRGFERRHYLRCLLGKPGKHLRRAMRPEGWIRTVVLAAVAILLAALLLWLGGILFASPSDSGRGQNPPGHSFRAQVP